MLINQEKMRPPSEVPRHGMSNEWVDIESLNKEVDARTSSQGHLGLENDNHRRLPGKDVSEQWTAYNTPSQTHEIQTAGYLPAFQHPTCLKTRNENYYGPQMAINSFQQELFNSSGSQNM